MPIISNLKSQSLPGFDKPLTTFEISPGNPKPSSGSKNPWSNVQFINSAGDGYGPHATTLGDIANKIPSKPSLKKSCEKCGKRPDQEGPGYPGCASCKVARYCSRECQTGHWKAHKKLCKSRVEHAGLEPKIEAEALRAKEVFVSQATLRKWYYDNVDIVDYAIVQTLELYKGRAHSLWRTHAAVFHVAGGKMGTSATASEIDFDDAEAASFPQLANSLDLSPIYLNALGAGSRIMLVFILNDHVDLMLVESHDLPADAEWAGMEKDEMWRMHIRLRDMARDSDGSDSEDDGKPSDSD